VDAATQYDERLMLERLVVLQHHAGHDAPRVDLGLLVEQLLFYGEVHFYVGPGHVQVLLERLGAEQLKALLELDFLRLHYFEESLGIYDNGGILTPIAVKPRTAPDGTPRPLAAETFIPAAVEKAEGSARKALSRAILEKVKIESFASTNVLADTTADFLNPKWMAVAIPTVLSATAAPQTGVKFEVARVGNGVRVETNIDFSKATGLLGGNAPLTTAHLLGYIADAQRHMQAAAKEQGELFVTGVGAKLFEAKLRTVIPNPSGKQIELFQEQLLDSTTAIRDAVNSGAVPTIDALKAIERTAKFKEWARGKEPDAKLLGECLKAVSRESPFDKLAGKTTKFLLFAGMGTIASLVIDTGTASLLAGAALNAIDTFMFDQLVKRWTPSVFVNDLQALVNK
jgi:hypothetical protein